MDEVDRIVEQWNVVRPDLDVSPTQTLQRITRLGLLQAASFARVFAPHGVSFGEYLVLAALRRAGPPYRMNPTKLFGAVILSSGAMTTRPPQIPLSASRTGAKAKTPSRLFGRNWIWSSSTPRSAYSWSAAASSAGSPRSSRSSGGRSAACGNTRTSASADFVSVAGSRPAARQASLTLGIIAAVSL